MGTRTLFAAIIWAVICVLPRPAVAAGPPGFALHIDCAALLTILSPEGRSSGTITVPTLTLRPGQSHLVPGVGLDGMRDFHVISLVTESPLEARGGLRYLLTIHHGVHEASPDDRNRYRFLGDRERSLRFTVYPNGRLECRSWDRSLSFDPNTGIASVDVTEHEAETLPPELELRWSAVLTDDRHGVTLGRQDTLVRLRVRYVPDRPRELQPWEEHGHWGP